MRTELEIQRAHDLLVGVILGEVPGFTIEQMDALAKLASVLCWVLGDDHKPGEMFACALHATESKARAAGFVLERRDN